VKNQLTQELQHLTTSFSQLKQAQAKFRDCGGSIRDGLQKGEGECLFGVLEGGGKKGRERRERRSESRFLCEIVVQWRRRDTG